MKSQIDISRLVQTIRRDRLVLQRFRTNRNLAVRQQVGQWWSDNGAKEAVPINLINKFCTTYARYLVPKNPKALLSTYNRRAKPTVSAMQTWVNDQIEAINLAGTLRRCVHDGFYHMMICKVALGTPADAARLAWNLNAGEAFAECVDFDDFVFSTNARTFAGIEYIGHRVRVPIDVVKDSKEYTKLRKQIEPMDDAAFNESGDERISMIGRSWYGYNTQQFRDWVDLWEIYIPHERLVLTLAGDQIGLGSGLSMDEALKEQQWIGDPSGPYVLDGFGTVPGQAMPIGPIANIFDIHMHINRSARKLFRQSERTKDLLFVQGGADKDGKRVIDANDGDVIRVDNPDKMVPASMGGANQKLVNSFEMMLNHANVLMGNPDLLGGAAPQSKTAAQDKMLNQNASVNVADMQGTVLEVTAEVLLRLCWYWHHDPFKKMQTSWSAEGVPEIAINRTVTPRQRMQVPWKELKVQCDPYSLQHSTPQSRMAALDQTVMNIIIPLMPILQQQGRGFDVGKYLELKAKYGDMPDLPDIVTIMEPVTTTENGAGGGQPQAPAGDRTVTRVNMPGRTEQGDAMNRRNQAAGINPGGNPAMTAKVGMNGNGQGRQLIA